MFAYLFAYRFLIIFVVQTFLLVKILFDETLKYYNANTKAKVLYWTWTAIFVVIYIVAIKETLL